MVPSSLRRIAISTLLAAAFAVTPAVAATPEETAARLEALGINAGSKKPTAATLGEVTTVSLYGDRAKGLTDADCALFATLPNLQQVMLTGTRVSGACTEALSKISTLRTVSLATGEFAPGALAAFGHTASLESLQLNDMRGMTPQDLGALSGLKALRYVTIAFNTVPVGRTSWFDDRALAEIGKFSGVQTMALVRVRATAKGMAAIAAMPALRELTIERGDFAEEALEPLAGSRLVALGLPQNPRLAKRATEILARITTLQRLTLTYATAGGSLAPLAGLANLSSLDVSNSFVTSDDLVALAGAPALTELTANDNAAIDDRGATALTASKKLRSVAITRTSVGDAGLAALMAIPTLRSLYADDLAVGDGFTAAAAKSQIVNIQVGNSDVGDAGLLALVDAPQLGTISVRTSRVTDAGIAAAKAKRANLNVYK